MRNRLIYHLTILLVILFLCNQNERAKAQTHIDFIDSIEIVLNEKVPELIKEYNVPCIGIGIIENSKIKYLKVYGEHQLGKKAPQNTIFDIASITKVVVTVTTLKLIDSGTWDLDEPLYPYWVDPDLLSNERYKMITTRHLLSHSAGFKNWRNNKLTIDFEPGSGFLYSGEGFEYLQKAIENKFNKSLDKIVDSVLFNPLKMEDATMVWHNDIDESRFAYWYNTKGERYLYENYKNFNPSAADCIKLTTEDLTKFGVYVINGAGIKEKLFKEMVNPQPTTHPTAFQGLGWELVRDLPGGDYLITHDGEDPGVNTTIILFPETQKGIIILTNGDNGRIVSNKILRSVFVNGDLIVNKIYWKREIPQVIDVADTVLNNIIGSYKIDGGGSFIITKKNKNLVAEGGWGIPQFDFYPQSETKYFTYDRDLVFEFLEDENQKVDSFRLFWHGKMIYSGKKRKENEE